MNGVSHLRKARLRFKKCRDHTFCRESYVQCFLGLSRHLVDQFSDRTTNHQHSLLYEASQRLSKASLLFKMTGFINQKCLLHENACLHITPETTPPQEMHWEAITHPASSPALAPNNFHMFSPLKEALGGKRLRADD
jgi:hypothetical protein